MGDISDYYYKGRTSQELVEYNKRDIEFTNISDIKVNPLKYSPEIRREYIIWNSKNGEQFLLKDMKNSHIINSINYLKNKVNRGDYNWNTHLLERINTMIRVLKEEQLFREILRIEKVKKKREFNAKIEKLNKLRNNE